MDFPALGLGCFSDSQLNVNICELKAIDGSECWKLYLLLNFIIFINILVKNESLT